MVAARTQAVVLLCIGLVAMSTSVIFIKASELEPVWLACLRLVVAVVALSPLYLRDLRRHGTPALRRTLAPGLILGLHFIGWIIGARLTPAVNSSLLVNMVPVVTPLGLMFIAGERLQRREWFGTLIAVGGVALLVGADYQLNPQYFLGDSICFGAMVLFALYIALGRRNRDFATIWLYVVPLYAWAALLCLVVALFTGEPLSTPISKHEVGMILGLGLLPTVLGHSFLNNAMKHLRGQVVSVANLLQVCSAGILAYVILDEVPDVTFYPLCGLIAVGVVITVWRPSTDLGGLAAIDRE